MRWLVLLLFAICLATGCDLNPQPEVPGADEPEPGAAGGSAGAAGARGDFGPPGARDDDRSESSDPADYNGGLQAGKAERPDGGRVREAPDAGVDAPSAPPVVVVQ